MKTKKIVALFAVALLLIVGIKAVIYGYKTYTANTSNMLVTDNGDGTYSYGKSDGTIDGVQDYIVAKNVTDAQAVNNVAAIVFDFRGYDTLGESFILLTAIAGSFVILSKNKKKKEDKPDEV